MLSLSKMWTLPLVFALALPASSQDREMFEVWLCPIHRDEQSTGPAMCPQGDREMVKRFLSASYSCPMHQHIDQEHEGACPICGMNLATTTRELQWFCPDQPEILSAEPGTCPSGAAMDMRSIPMAHGDHNPKHGGILFMAPNGYNHLEGTLDEDGTFRLYMYNDFTKPIDPAPFRARVNDEALSPEPDGEFLAASVGAPESYPAEYVVHIAFPGEHDDEARFDFIFVESMVKGEQAVRTSGTIVMPEFRIPDNPDEIFEAILSRDARIRELIANGVWPDLYIPALEAKDLVLALSDVEGERVSVAAKKLVRAAWLLDVYGDMGNRVEVERAYLLFEESIQVLEAARAK